MENELLGVGLRVPEGVILKPIPGIPDTLYMAGSDGHIYSYSNASTNAKKPKPFRLASVRNNNYFLVSIFYNGKKRTYSVHELVNAAFHGIKPIGKSVSRHLDGDWSNNKPENLCWGTYAENEADKRRHGRTAYGERQGIAKLTDEAVKIIRASIPYGLWNTGDAAKVFGVTPKHIGVIARGIGWKHVT